MTRSIPPETFKGTVTEVVLGADGKTLTLGGENAPAFHGFEGAWPHPPALALEVRDRRPEDWPADLVDTWGRVLDDPVAWARAAAANHGAEAIFLRLDGTEAGDDFPDEAADLARRVSDAGEAPLVIYGPSDEDRRAAILTAVAAACPDRNLFLGPVLGQNFGPICEAAAKYGHGVVIQTAVHLPQAKELSTKVRRILPPEKILFDPLCPALGYGLEYGYSVMEREKLAAVSFNDPTLQMPLMAVIGHEAWETKEAKQDPTQGLLWEAMTGTLCLLAGADLVVVRHPRTLHLLRRIRRGS
jgi:acetyl-CoA decarbonylase/synthase complex subunit delta